MEEMSEETAYANSKNKHPDKAKRSGKGDYCCIPHCKSSFYKADGKTKTGIALFKLPTDPTLRRKWLRVIQRYRRSGGADKFSPSSDKKIMVCQFHFPQNQIRVSLGIGRKTYLPGSVPSVFEFKSTDVKTRKPPAKRKIFEESSESEYISETSSDNDEYIENNPVNEIQNTAEQNDLVERIRQLEDDNEKLYSENKLLRLHVYNYENVSQSQEEFKTATGLDVESFDIIFELLNPGEDCCNIQFYETTSRSNDTSSRDLFCKAGPKPKLSEKDQFFLFISWLRNGYSRAHLSFLFKISKTTVSRYLITWVNFCYFCLGSIPIWPSRESIDDTMPQSFKKAYASTRCILDCTELFCQTPSSLATQSCMYSHYKNHVTYKGLLGVAPSGSIIFVSQLFDGSTSDKEIVRRSGILDSKLWKDGDSVMADRGFTIEDDLKPFNVSLNIPAFLGGRKQLTATEVKESQAIASVRIHVERAISRVKKFRILKNIIPLTFHGSINQVWTVCCLLCNFMSPLIQKNS